MRIAPKTYHENLIINGQQIVLQNAGAANAAMPLIKSADPQGTVVSYLNGGGGALVNLRLRGGAIGVGAGLFDAEQSTDITTDLQIQGVQITKAGRGIAGQFHSLTIAASEVAKSRVHGVWRPSDERLVAGSRRTTTPGWDCSSSTTSPRRGRRRRRRSATASSSRTVAAVSTCAAARCPSRSTTAALSTIASSASIWSPPAARRSTTVPSPSAAPCLGFGATAFASSAPIRSDRHRGHSS